MFWSESDSIEATRIRRVLVSCTLTKTIVAEGYLGEKDRSKGNFRLRVEFNYTHRGTSVIFSTNHDSTKYPPHLTSHQSTPVNLAKGERRRRPHRASRGRVDASSSSSSTLYAWTTDLWSFTQCFGGQKTLVSVKNFVLRASMRHETRQLEQLKKRPLVRATPTIGERRAMLNPVQQLISIKRTGWKTKM